MDKEEAMKILKDFHDKSALFSVRTALETLHPELKESEDEKTRKRIIALVNAHGQGIYKGDMLTWLENIPYTIDHEKREGFHLGYKAGLEKQKTKKNEWLFEKGKWYVKLQHHYEGDLRHFEKGHVYQALSEVEITDGYHNVSLGSWEIPEYFRPATKDEIPEETKQTSRLDEDEEIRNYFINAVKEQPNIYQEWKEKCLNWLEKQGEQKPTEWSEEDEEMFGYALDMIEWYSGKNEDKSRAVSDWLKSLKPQPKQKWDEEDEKMFKSLKTLLNNASCYSCTEGVDKILSWVKSLKQRIGG